MSEILERQLLGIGHSQRPLIRHLSSLKLTHTSSDLLTPGTLVVYESGPLLICHRILLKRRLRNGRTEYLIKGDAKAIDDGWIAEERIKGKVSAVNGKNVESVVFAAATLFLYLFSLSTYLIITCIRFFDKLIYTLQRESWRILWEMRKIMGTQIFNSIWTPPKSTNPRIQPHGNDYGHGFLYEEVFCRTLNDVNTISQMVMGCQGKLLDLAGGAGRLSLRLASMGRDITLVDKSKDMLLVAQQRALQLGLGVHSRILFHQADICDMELGSQFTFIVSLQNGLEHLLSPVNLKRALENIFYHLTKDGVTVIDVHNPQFWEKTKGWKQKKWVYLDDFKVNQCRYRLWERTDGGEIKNYVTWEHALTEDLVNFTHLRTQLNLMPLESWLDILSEAGFLVSKIWGDWTGHPPSRTTPKLIFHLTKRQKLKNGK